MVGKRDVIAMLNKMLLNELTAIDQYFLHARMLRNWGLHDLGDIIYKESIGEMRHADWIIERILFLDGLPNLQELGKLRIGENALEVLRSDLDLEMVARNDTADAITLFERGGRLREPRHRDEDPHRLGGTRRLPGTTAGSGEAARTSKLSSKRDGAGEESARFPSSSRLISGRHWPQRAVASQASYTSFTVDAPASIADTMRPSPSALQMQTIIAVSFLVGPGAARGGVACGRSEAAEGLDEIPSAARRKFPLEREAALRTCDGKL